MLIKHDQKVKQNQARNSNPSTPGVINSNNNIPAPVHQNQPLYQVPVNNAGYDLGQNQVIPSSGYYQQPYPYMYPPQNMPSNGYVAYNPMDYQGYSQLPYQPVPNVNGMMMNPQIIQGYSQIHDPRNYGQNIQMTGNQSNFVGQYQNESNMCLNPQNENFIQNQTDRTNLSKKEPDVNNVTNTDKENKKLDNPGAFTFNKRELSKELGNFYSFL